MKDQVADRQGGATRFIGKRELMRSLGRAARYLTVRGLIVLLTVLVGIYAAIWVVNWGGASDPVRKQQIEYEVRMAFGGRGFNRRIDLTFAEKAAVLQWAVDRAWEAADLYEPFAVRSIRYFREACTLSLGESITRRTRTGSTKVSAILLQHVPMTLLLFGVANLLVFLVGLFVPLSLSRRYGSLLDRLTTLAAPILAAPPWFHGFILIVIFASVLKLLPFGGIVGAPLPEPGLPYVLGVLKHLILPVSAIVLGTAPFTISGNRALFLIHSNEDYVEMARAKGASPRRISFQHILRPTLPPIITNFVFILILAWEGVVITENVFNWPGLGRLLLEAIDSFDVSMVTGGVTVFAYLLGLSVFFLDVVYVLVDPRVLLGGGRRA